MVVLGLVAETKENDEGEFPIFECYRNMSAVAASLVVSALQQGVMMDDVSIYGAISIVSKIYDSNSK